jgi:nitroreductase
MGRMELQEAVRRRRMVRSYDPDRPVPRAVLDRLLELAIRAPSAGFSQGWDFVVLTGADRDRFWDCATEPGRPADPWLTGMRSAPALLVCLSDPQRYLDRYAEPDKGWTDRDPARWPVPYWDTDVAMAAMTILLGLVDHGLAGCFFGVPPQQQAAVLAGLDAPSDRRIVGVISAGHPAPDRRSPSLRRRRRPVSEVAHDGRFGTPWAAATGDPSGSAPRPGPARSAPGSA